MDGVSALLYRKMVGIKDLVRTVLGTEMKNYKRISTSNCSRIPLRA